MGRREGAPARGWASTSLRLPNTLSHGQMREGMGVVGGVGGGRVWMEHGGRE